MAKTIDEISKDTGFSRTTITMVLNGRAERYRISAKTRGIIEDYVALHGCVINHTARSLKLRRSDVIGFVAPDLANAFFARLMAALEVFCGENGLVLVTTSTHEDPETEKRALENLAARGVDGVILAPCGATGPKTPLLGRRKTPLVIIDRARGGGAVPIVTTDHEGAALIVARDMMAAAGSLAFLCGQEDNPSIQDRIRGFRAAAAERGLSEGEAPVATAPKDSADAGRALMEALSKRLGRPPRAFLCSSLLVLEGALRQLKASLGSIPGDMLIGTFDWHGLLDALPNPVWAMRQDEVALARAAFDRLRERMDGATGPAPIVTIPGELIRVNA